MATANTVRLGPELAKRLAEGVAYLCARFPRIAFVCLLDPAPECLVMPAREPGDTPVRSLLDLLDDCIERPYRFQIMRGDNGRPLLFMCQEDANWLRIDIGERFAAWTSSECSSIAAAFAAAVARHEFVAATLLQRPEPCTEEEARIQAQHELLGPAPLLSLPLCGAANPWAFVRPFDLLALLFWPARRWLVNPSGSPYLG